MKKESSHRTNVMVQILDTQHATWQGTVTWIDTGRKESFRSALELLRLIDSAQLAQQTTASSPADG